MVIRAVGFDLFGTIVEAIADVNVCIGSLGSYLRECGYEFPDDNFAACYRATSIEIREKRHDELREVNNCVWVADTLRKLNLKADPSSQIIKSAVERYFKPWELTVAEDAHEVLGMLRDRFSVSLVSNFTDSTFLHRSLRSLGIEAYFDHVIDSDTVGWRKPHPEIFNQFLKLSRVKPREAIFVGDDLEADVKGAKNSGIKAVWLNRSGGTPNQKEVEVHPDYTVDSLSMFGRLLLESLT